MAGSLVSLTILTIFCVSAAGNRTQLLSGKGIDGLSALLLPDSDGVCSSMIKNHGYSCQEHNVTTKDGYILSLQRIPAGRSGGTTGTRPPVLVVHGVFMAYWDWSLDELVAYDLPETVDYIHNLTGQKLHYIGQSLGTMTAFAAFSRNLLIDKLRSAVLLCPVAYLGQVNSPLARAAAETFVAEVNTSSCQQSLSRGAYDQNQIWRIHLLENMLLLLIGKNCCLDPSISSILLEHEPQSTATKNMIHLAQMIREGTFTMYDYKDAKENVKHYKKATPEPYNLSCIPSDIPLYLSYGGADALTDEKDIELLLNSLQGHDKDKLVVQRIEKYAHGDYVMGDNAWHVVYDPLIAFLKLHQ
ncbi:triacylglycerol lipase 2-like [Tripterygium wilfordii]|uniref:Triacylglycerol lipase 2-like n=1 Tax=Tripterygium wilfordii TaxID=458696 RepID=A0A7J7BY53_TRIWF|nr:triacylglycerol lipase 2-like [Tripterygium wilfordii]